MLIHASIGSTNLKLYLLSIFFLVIYQQNYGTRIEWFHSSINMLQLKFLVSVAVKKYVLCSQLNVGISWYRNYTLRKYPTRTPHHFILVCLSFGYPNIELNKNAAEYEGAIIFACTWHLCNGTSFAVQSAYTKVYIAVPDK